MKKHLLIGLVVALMLVSAGVAFFAPTSVSAQNEAPSPSFPHGFDYHCGFWDPGWAVEAGRHPSLLAVLSKQTTHPLTGGRVTQFCFVTVRSRSGSTP